MSATVRLGRITVDMGARKPAAPPVITTAYLNAWRELPGREGSNG